MAENEPLTPEKQLLNLIENPKQALLHVESAKRESKKWFSFSALKGRLAFWKGFSLKKWFSFALFTKSSGGIRQLNRVLILFIIFMGVYFSYNTVQLSLDLKKASNLILKPDKEFLASMESVFELKNVSYYLEKFNNRSLFNVKEIPKPQVKEQEAPVSAQASDATKDYSLVGIAWSSDPEAMVEHVKTSKTYFVKRGQNLENGVKVVTIFKDKVILSLSGKEFELR